MSVDVKGHQRIRFIQNQVREMVTLDANLFVDLSFDRLYWTIINGLNVPARW